MGRERVRAGAGLVLAALACAVAPATAAANNYTLTPAVAASTMNGNCNWVEAVKAAFDDGTVDACPAGTGDDVLTFTAGEYTLPGPALFPGDPNTGDTTTLQAAPGAAVTIRQTGSTNQVIDTTTNAGGVTLDGLTVTGGHRTGGAVGGGVSIGSSGFVVIRNSTITGNSVGGPNPTDTGDGGGVGVATATVPVTIINSTISNNSATRNGGGVEVGSSTFTIINSTITGNRANSAGGAVGGTGGGIHRYGTGPPNVELRNTIIAGNSAPANTGPDCANLSAAVFSTSNIIGDNTACSYAAAPTDKIGVNPLLGPLAANGGGTQTYALLAGSPAIDAAKFTCPATDQRGLPRPALAGCDIGAYELQPPAPPVKKKCKKSKGKGKGKKGAAAAKTHRKKGCKKKRKKGK